MKFSDFIKTGKGKVLTIGGVAVVAVGIGIAILSQGKGYRNIIVDQVEGTVSIVGTSNNGQAYKGERLFSGDDVTVADASSLVMKMDADKYVYADANTHFYLQSESDSDSSRIKLYLDKGSELNVLQSKLGPDDSYEVDTPNSTMAVRGTKFRVTVYYGDDGLVYTKLEVEEGEVFVRLKTKAGTYNGVERSFKAGESCLIRGNDDFSEFVTDGEMTAQNASGTGAGESSEAANKATPSPTPTATPTASPTPSPKTTVKPSDDSSSGDSGNADASADTPTADPGSASANKTDPNAPHEHIAGGWVTTGYADCMNTGQRVQKCTICGAVLNSEEIPKGDHQWTEDGNTRTCSVCGASEYTGPEPSQQQSEPEQQPESQQPAGCSHNWTGPYQDTSYAGLVKEYMQCSICGEINYI